MPHFLDLHTTDRAALRGILERAAAMKAARAGRPRGRPTTTCRLPGGWWR